MKLLGFLFVWFLAVQPVWADEPSYTASPSAYVSPAPTAVKEFICQQLLVVSGSNTLAPATVTFRVTTDGSVTVTKYRFHFGDGTVEDFSTNEASHTYQKAGTYEPFVELYDTAGVVSTSDGCRAVVTVNAPPLVQETTGCSEILVTGGSKPAPVTATITVKGYGSPSEYRVVYHDDKVDTASGSGVFSRTYDQAGTYKVEGFVREPEGNWVGGSGACQNYVYVYSGGMTSQPQTGVSTGTWVAIGAAVVAGMGLVRMAWERRRSG